MASSPKPMRSDTTGQLALTQQITAEHCRASCPHTKKYTMLFGVREQAMYLCKNLKLTFCVLFQWDMAHSISHLPDWDLAITLSSEHGVHSRWQMSSTTGSTLVDGLLTGVRNVLEISTIYKTVIGQYTLSSEQGADNRSHTICQLATACWPQCAMC